MIALPILGAFAPLAHTAVSCLCVCCAHFVSTGLTFRPTSGRWIGFSISISDGSLVDDVRTPSLMDLWWLMFECRLWYCVCSRNCDILLVFPANWFLSKRRTLFPLTFVGYDIPTFADDTWILTANLTFKRSTDCNTAIKVNSQYYLVAWLSFLLFFIAWTLPFMSGLFLSYCFAGSWH